MGMRVPDGAAGKDSPSSTSRILLTAAKSRSSMAPSLVAQLVAPLMALASMMGSSLTCRLRDLDTLQPGRMGSWATKVRMY